VAIGAPHVAHCEVPEEVVHESVRSTTTRRYRPGRSLDSLPRLAMRGMTPPLAQGLAAATEVVARVGV
jgi:hypothetical protein